MDYVIGAGAVLERGARASITPATLHARVEDSLAARIQVAAVDFEGNDVGSMRRLLLIVAGWSAPRFHASVTTSFLKQGECSLADVLALLAEAACVKEVHLFANWLPDADTCSALQRKGVTLVNHPVEAIAAAALVAGQRHVVWGKVPAA